MEVNEQIIKFKEFLDNYYLSEILENIRLGNRFLAVDFALLSKHDPELADLVLEQPEELLKAFEICVENFDLQTDLRNFKIRLKNLPANQTTKIKDIRSDKIGKLLTIEGIVRQKSDVRPQVTVAKFECPSCGNVISVIQVDTSFKEPFKCGCGRKGKFRLLDKELVDAQRIVLEENPEDLEGGEQPKRMGVYLKSDLVSPFSEKKTNPGSKVRIIGQVKELPIILKTGGKSTTFDLMIEANNVEGMEESYGEILINPEEEKKIIELSQDKNLMQKLIKSIAPSIYGHEKVKEALLLQMMSGVKKKREEGVLIRGDIHVLLIGDPGCIVGNSQVALLYKGMEQIKNIGIKHLQPIKEVVTKMRKDNTEKPYDFATVFHHYKKQPVLKVITETGKEVICTYNQPFLTKEGWKRADELLMEEKIRVMPKIPNLISKLCPTGFVQVEKKNGRLKDVLLPEFFTPELASLCGYLIGDGNIHSSDYRVTCYINNEETDLIEQLSGLWKSTFNVEPAIITANTNPTTKTIEDSNGLLREFISTQQINIMEIYSRQVAQSLSFLANKKVPQQIFKSPKKVVADFISWLFEADGCSFGNGRGRTSVQLKSRTLDLLKDTQLLLLYFGIQSRIIEDNLCIRRSRDMELFAKHIGFKSIKKKKKLELVLEVIKNRSDYQKRKVQRYEKVVKILPVGISDVYDFEVPISKMFIANGIVCHNSGKSQLLRRISAVAPKSRFVSGKGVSGVGLTASVVRDEFLKGWSLEAGALVLANKGFCMIDELDKMNKEDRAAMHEALEQQSVSIAKANIQATLRSETTVLAAANPKFGRFDPYGTIAEQIDLPPTLINRFDLIFPIKDLPNAEHDERIAKFILTMHQDVRIEKPEVDTKLLKKYISYARQRISPELTDGALEEIKEYYVKMRGSGSSEGGVRSIPISARQLEALVRLSEASAKVRLSEKVIRKDAKRAIDLVHYCLMQVGLDQETGKFDIDRISTGITASQRSKISIIREIINDLEEKLGKTIPIEDVIKIASERGIDESEVEETIEKLKRSGDLYEPRHGLISRI